MENKAEQERKPVGSLVYYESGESIDYYSAEKMLAAYRLEVSSLGPYGLSYKGVSDEELSRGLYSIAAGELGFTADERGNAVDEQEKHGVVMDERPSLADPEIAAVLTEADRSSVPDQTITAAEIAKFGDIKYHEDMLLMRPERARELFDAGVLVCELSGEGRYVEPVFKRGEIHDAAEMYGVDRGDWLVYRAQTKIAEKERAAEPTKAAGREPEQRKSAETKPRSMIKLSGLDNIRKKQADDVTRDKKQPSRDERVDEER